MSLSSFHTKPQGKKAYLVRYGEIALKGKNRRLFEERLVHALRAYARATGKIIERIIRPRGRIVIFTDDELDLSRIFGIVSYSPAQAFVLPSSLQEDPQAAQAWLLAILQPFLQQIVSPFRVSAQRITKTFPLNSMEINRVVGGFIKQQTQSVVDLTHPKTEVILEIIENTIFVSLEKREGPGGLPVGVEGKAFLLVKNNLAAQAGIAALKRGVRVYPLFLRNTPQEKMQLLMNTLFPFTYGYELQSFQVSDFHEETLHVLANQKNIFALVLPDTLDALSDEYSHFLCLRPLLSGVPFAFGE